MGRGRGTTQVLEQPVRRRAVATGVSIDLATTTDVRSMRQLKQTFAQRELKPLHGLKATKEWIRLNCTQKVLRQQLEEGQQFVIARNGDAVVGLAAVEQHEDRVDITGLYLLEPNPEVATQLSEHLEKEAKRDGCVRARVPVLRSDEQYRRLLQERGFVGAGQGERDPVFGVIVDYYEKTL